MTIIFFNSSACEKRRLFNRGIFKWLLIMSHEINLPRKSTQCLHIAIWVFECYFFSFLYITNSLVLFTCCLHQHWRYFQKTNYIKKEDIDARCRSIHSGPIYLSVLYSDLMTYPPAKLNVPLVSCRSPQRPALGNLCSLQPQRLVPRRRIECAYPSPGRNL